MIKVFQVTECDWVAAASAEEALKFYNQFCEGATEFSEVTELTPADMIRLKHRGEDGVEYDPPITFQEELEKNIAEGIEFPCLFATSEI